MYVIKSSVSDFYFRARGEGGFDWVRHPGRATGFATRADAEAFKDRHFIEHGIVVDADEEEGEVDVPELGGEG
jgi:hypothetical protein